MSLRHEHTAKCDECGKEVPARLDGNPRGPRGESEFSYPAGWHGYEGFWCCSHTCIAAYAMRLGNAPAQPAAH